MPEDELKKILKVAEEGDFALFDEIQGTRDDISTLAKSIQKILEQKQNINVDTKTITEAIKSGFSSLKTPEAKISIPEINTKGLENAVKEAVRGIKISVPKSPDIIIPKTEFPDKMVVEGEISLRGVNPDNPLPVQLHDSKGNPLSLEKLTQDVSNGGMGGGSRGISSVKFVDENGATYGIKHIANKIQNSSTPHLYDVVTGNVQGKEPITILGYNSDVDDTREDLWEMGGVYVFPPAGGIQMKIVSTSVNDTATGTGARTVKIHYLDSNYMEQTEAVVLNGITAVNTVATNILRINDIHVMTVGSGGITAGNLSLTNIAGTITYGYIAAYGNASRQGIYTVPTGKTLYITGLNVGTGSAAGNRFAEFTLRVTTSHNNELTPGVFHFKSIVTVQDGSIFIPFCLPIKCIATSDVKISVTSDSVTANAICAGHFGGWLE